MSDLYPDESQKMDVIGHLEELRRRVFLCLGFLGVSSCVFFACSRNLMMIVKRPIQNHVSDLIFIGPTEAFIASVKVAVLSGLLVAFPLILHQAWAFLSAAAPRPLRKRIVSWLILALMLSIGTLKSAE